MPDMGNTLRIVQDLALMPWNHLATLGDAVVVCSRLGHAIRPIRELEVRTASTTGSPWKAPSRSLHVESRKDHRLMPD